MCHSEFLLFLSDYLFNFYLCELSAMTILLTIVLATLHLENDDLVTLYKRVHNLYYYLGTFYSWCAHCDSALFVYEEHFVKLNGLTSLYILDVVNEELLALGHLELLTVNFYNCVHYL